MSEAHPSQFARPIAVCDIPAKGLRQRLEATRSECHALAARLGVDKVVSLTALLEVKPWRSTGICVSGTLNAEVEQRCVVTLEPLTNALSAEVLVYFVREAPRGERGAATDVFVDPLDEEPEVLHGSTLDLGELVVEHTILAVDPYPRRDGAELPLVPDGGEAADGSGPFSALAALHKAGKDK